MIFEQFNIWQDAHPVEAVLLGGLTGSIFWMLATWLYQHRPVSRRRYNKDLSQAVIIAALHEMIVPMEKNEALLKRLRAKSQPRDPATGKFCKREG